jgi:hypothetical protein
MADEKIVQTETPSTGVVPQVTPVPTPQPLPDVKEIVRQEMEAIKRQLQSEKDKSIAEVRREAEKTIGLYKRQAEELATQFGAVDPQAAELARLKSQEKYYREQETEEMTKKQLQDFDANFRDSIGQALQAMEIDPVDKRLDWAEDAMDYVVKQRRVLLSAARINSDKNKALKEEVKKSIADETAKLRRELGFDSVDTGIAASGGVGTFTRGSIAKMSLEDYEKNEKAIRKALNEGRIK